MSDESQPEIDQPSSPIREEGGIFSNLPGKKTMAGLASAAAVAGGAFTAGRDSAKGEHLPSAVSQTQHESMKVYGGEDGQTALPQDVLNQNMQVEAPVEKDIDFRDSTTVEAELAGTDEKVKFERHPDGSVHIYLPGSLAADLVGPGESGEKLVVTARNPDGSGEVRDIGPGILHEVAKDSDGKIIAEEKNSSDLDYIEVNPTPGHPAEVDATLTYPNGNTQAQSHYTVNAPPEQ